jgi:hypothetical protein
MIVIITIDGGLCKSNDILKKVKINVGEVTIGVPNTMCESTFGPKHLDIE